MSLYETCYCCYEPCDPEDDGICQGCRALFALCPYDTNEDEGDEKDGVSLAAISAPSEWIAEVAA